MTVPRAKKKTERLSHIEDIDIMQKPVNGCTLDKKGRIIRVHLVGHYYLNVADRTLTNPYASGERKITVTATRDAVRRAKLWRTCWEACSAE